MATVNDTQATIIQQARAQGIRTAELLLMDENTVRFHRRRRSGYNAVNMDVTYVPGLDLYNVARHDIGMSADYHITTETETTEGVYADALAAIWK